MTLLTLKNLSVRRGQCPVVDNVSLEIRSHELVGLVGPNGAGKTTLLKAALGLIEHSGDSSLAKLPLNERSSRAAWMPQERRSTGLFQFWKQSRLVSFYHPKIWIKMK